MNTEQMIKLLAEEMRKEIEPMQNMLKSQQELIESQQRAIEQQQKLIEAIADEQEVQGKSLGRIMAG